MNFILKSKFFFLILFILFINVAVSQGLVDGFYNGSQSYTIVLGAGYENNPIYLAGNRELGLDKSFENMNLFASYGILDDLDLSLSAAYVKSKNVEDFQDARILLKYKFYKIQIARLQVSFQVATGMSFPLSNYETEGLNAIGQRTVSIPSRILIHGQHNNGLFITMQTGYDLKFKPVSDSFAGTFKIGLAKQKFYIDANFSYQNSVQGLDYRGNPAPNNFRELEVDFMKVGSTLYIPVTGNLGGFINGAYTFDGRNVGKGPAVNIGIVFKNKKMSL